MIGRDISAVRSHGQYWSSCQMKNFLGNSRGESFLQPPPSMCPDDDDIDLKFVRQCFQCIPDFALANYRLTWRLLQVWVGKQLPHASLSIVLNLGSQPRHELGRQVLLTFRRPCLWVALHGSVIIVTVGHSRSP